MGRMSIFGAEYLEAVREDVVGRALDGSKL
jgi:hypothetical protein